MTRRQRQWMRLWHIHVRAKDGDAVAAIALGAGFNDLSTVNRRFRRVTGQEPHHLLAALAPGLGAAPFSDLLPPFVAERYPIEIS